MAAPLASKLKIAEHYLLSAPPAQLDEVQKDVVTLLKPAAFDAAGLLAAREAYNVSNNVCAKVADGALPVSARCASVRRPGARMQQPAA